MAKQKEDSQKKLTEVEPTISLCMIVKDEEQWLAQCLESVKDLVNEIILIDTGSTDKTKEIAKKFNAKIFDFAWTDNFADARNFSISKAAGDWILWLDADETIAEKDHDYIRQIVKEAQFPVVVMEQRHYTNDTTNARFKEVDERYEAEAKDCKGYYATLITRLFKNNVGLTFEGAVHETLDKSMQKLGLKFLRTDIPIHHYQHLKSEDKMKEKKQKYDKLLEEKAKSDPTDIKTLHDLAITNLHKNDFRTAFDYFKKIYDLDKELLEPYLGMGLIWAKRGDYPRAIKFFLNAMDKKTTRTIELSIPIEQVRENILYNLALSFLKTGEKAKGIQIFKDMIRLNSRYTPLIQKKLKEVGIVAVTKAG
ncbi:glycosyltransferase family 2 protein [Candidatus Woesearchaeota archaeon]|nr:glycosyltransferase family 2 protein [Candidatus Woesearchaeota archaeon]